MNPILIITLVVALLALAGVVYIATRPPPASPPASSGLGGVVGTVLHLAGVP